MDVKKGKIYTRPASLLLPSSLSRVRAKFSSRILRDATNTYQGDTHKGQKGLSFAPRRSPKNRRLVYLYFKGVEGSREARREGVQGVRG